jgi:hypothetical protein
VVLAIWLAGRIFDSKFIIIKEIITEGLLVGVIINVYIFNQGNFVGDLDTKVAIGWNMEYLVIAILAVHGVFGTVIIWRLLKDLETSLPEQDDPTKGFQKQVDLFRLKQKNTDKPVDIFD